MDGSLENGWAEGDEAGEYQKERVSRLEPVDSEMTDYSECSSDEDSFYTATDLCAGKYASVGMSSVSDPLCLQVLLTVGCSR